MLSLYRPGKALSATEVEAGRITGQSAHEGDKFVNPTHRLPLPPTIYHVVLVSLPACREWLNQPRHSLLLTQIKLNFTYAQNMFRCCDVCLFAYACETCGLPTRVLIFLNVYCREEYSAL